MCNLGCLVWTHWLPFVLLWVSLFGFFGVVWVSLLSKITVYAFVGIYLGPGVPWCLLWLATFSEALWYLPKGYGTVGPRLGVACGPHFGSFCFLLGPMLFTYGHLK
jgi:hypothetical protein